MSSTAVLSRVMRVRCVGMGVSSSWEPVVIPTGGRGWVNGKRAIPLWTQLPIHWTIFFPDYLYFAGTCQEGGMLDLNDFYLFVQVVDRGGFTAAARVLQLPKSTLSHRIQQLEAGL